MSMYKYSTNTVYFQKARFFRKDITHEFAYCIEPFTSFSLRNQYESTLNPYNINEAQKQRISRLAHFGYGYGNHTDIKWYAITQMLIWEAADPNSGSYYFTDTLNGNKIYPFNDEINELNNLVNNYDKTPSINNKTYSTYEEGTLTIKTDDTIKYYKSNDNRLKIEGNKIIIKNLPEGNYDFKLTRNDNTFNRPIVFYQSSESQNLVQTGDLDTKKIVLHVNSYKTSITINKIDKDTQEIKPQGEADLNGSIFKIYDNDNNEIKEVTIEDNRGIIENLDFGKYYIKEISPGTGYILNEQTYEIEITTDNPNPEITIENQVINKNIKIIKKYGDNSILYGEPNISFDIYNNEDKLIKTITTDNNGEVLFNLPYGTYKVIQKNSTEGYYKAETFAIIVSDTEEKIIELTDYKIPVPNTHTNSIFYLIYKFILKLLC